MKLITLRRYGLAAIFCGTALAVALPSGAPSSCFFLAVMASSLLGGKGPGLLSVGLSALAFDYFFLPPQFHLLAFAHPASYLRFAAFVGATLLVTGIIEIKRRVEESRSSERNKAERALQKAFADLKKSEDELREIINTIPMLAWSAGPDGSGEFFNRRWLDYTGLAAQQARDWGWKAAIHPDDVNGLVDYWQSILASGEPGEAEARLRRFDGEYRWFLFRSSALCDDSGKVVKWYGTNIDIDDRKNMEEALRSTQARLSRATQIATVGELAAAVAHEINQPLAAVVANGHACLRWLSAQPSNLFKAQEAAERIVRDGKEAGEVVRRIRALFKRDVREEAALDLNEIIGEVLRLLEGETRKRRVALETDLEKDLPRVAGDRVQLQQLVFNLLLNAIEAMDPVTDRPKRLSIRSKAKSQDTVLVEIRDYGVGLQDAEKVFEAFFTTKEKGMGMGLAICRSIIEAHRGRLWAVPGEEAGASFCFTLPVSPGGAL
jgi:PAS domain S-box-containing protein